MNRNHATLLILFVFASMQCMFAQQRPNIIVIMADDMGYSDMGSFGSEIETPNLDALAAGGLRFTKFYNQARCCPTRASLLTGLYPHAAGMGWMDAVNHQLPGYGAQLNDSSVTIAEVLKMSGYSTYMSGKWHLQIQEDTYQNSPNHNWPIQRGFDKFYGMLRGGGSFYDPVSLCRDNKLISPFNDPLYNPKDYYFTDAISDNAIRFINDDNGKNPFFLYVAYTSPHWPMHAPEKEIRKYKGRYDKGWDYIRQQRLVKMKKLGIVDTNVVLSPSETHSWEEEPDQLPMARRMETYAAMIDVMDQGIGRLVNELKRKGILENTIIFFLQDNGGNGEGVGLGGPEGATIERKVDGARPLNKEELQTDGNPPFTRDGKVVHLGKKVMAGPADTYLAYLKQWGLVSNTPFRKYKHYTHEGGIATPLIVHWPAGIKARGELRTQVGNVIDIMPTVIELSNAKYPAEYKGVKIHAEAGVSLVPAFANKSIKREAIFWEHEMNRAVRTDKWKLVSSGTLMDGGYGLWKNYQKGPWELYDMQNDPAESRDVSAQHPEILKRMKNMWDDWAKSAWVYPTPWQEIKQPVQPLYVDPILK
jgi:arylsulfatase A-like enzyme